MWIISVIVFFVIFSFVILIHEWGHFKAARKNGVHVEEFGLGVPPKMKTLYKDKKNCEYTLNWIPFGGFVRLEGEDEEGENEKKDNSPSSFKNASLFARMQIILAGVFMNFISALVILTVLFTIGAKPLIYNEDTIEKYNDLGYINFKQGLKIYEISEDSSLYNTEIKKGDLLLKIDDKEINNLSDLLSLQEKKDKALYTFLKGDKRIVKEVEIKNGKIGLALPSFPEIENIKKLKLPFFSAFLYSLDISKDIVIETVKAFLNVFYRMFTFQSLPKEVSGPVGIATMTHTLVINQEIEGIFKFVALISLSLGVINVLPIPALDGGRFLFLTYEFFMGKGINKKWEARIHMVFYVLLLLLIFLVTVNDIYKLFI
jgi:regulator of sigma E protease